MNRTRTTSLAICAAVLAMSGCFEPKDSRPGVRLRGDVAATLPADWKFTDAHREIAIEVRTPYLLPHSVTIWCVSDGGDLYVAARSPETKKWPGWVDRNPHVRLRIGDSVYEARLSPLDDPTSVEQVQRAYAAKYDLEVSESGPPLRYWRVLARD